MPWYNDLVSKAEAMLVKLDQDAAQALQDPEGLLTGGNKLLDTAMSTISTLRNPTPETELLVDDLDDHSYENVRRAITDTCEAPTAQKDSESFPTIPELPARVSSDARIPNAHGNHLQSDRYPDETTERIRRDSSELIQLATPAVRPDSLPSTPELPKPSYVRQDLQYTSHNAPVEFHETPTARNTRKFTIQTSRASSRPFQLDRKITTVSSDSDQRLKANGLNQSYKFKPTISSPGAEDIRASINRSLQEYTSQSSKRDSHHVSKQSPDSDSSPTAHSSHFDSRPNLAHHSSLLESNNSSPSFSIEVRDDRSIDGSTDNVATRLLQKSALKKKSTFYLHRVINKLANPNSQFDSIISDQMKIKYRRAQLRATSYARRLNYYFQTYPMMKYVIVGYLILMQLLVVYVLFFYQSNSSFTELSSQMKQQQEHLIETSNFNSDRVPLTRNLRSV